MQRISPLVISWCMRMEVKNSYFKKVARISNFKNVPYSVAKRHQHLLCAYIFKDSSFLMMNCNVVHVCLFFSCLFFKM